MLESSADCSANPQLVGDPVDTLSGAVVDQMLDFRLIGPLELRWTRYYDSSLCDRSFSVGRACAHEYDRFLIRSAAGLEYHEPVRRTLVFPPIEVDGNQHVLHGCTLRRVTADEYHLVAYAAPDMHFVFRPGEPRARLTRLVQGPQRVRFHYDVQQRLAGIDDSAGRRLVAAETDDGRLLRLSIDGGALLIAYEYDAQGNLVRTVNGEGHGYSFAYDEANRVVLREGRKGFKFYYKYDAQGRCVRSMGEDRLYGVILDYVVPGRLTRVTRPDGGVWAYTFTAQGMLQEVRDPLGGQQKFVRDQTGRQVQEIDPNGNLTEYVFDAAGAVVAQLRPFNAREPLPQDITASDTRGHRVAANAAEYEYGRLLDLDAAALPEREQIAASELPEHLQVLIKTQPPARQSTPRFEVPPLRAKWWPEPPSGRVFDDLGRLLLQSDEAGRQRRWRYDESGNIAAYLDFDGGRWTYDHGSWHLLRTRTDPCGNETRFTHTQFDNIASVIDAGGSGTEYRYDLKEFLVEVWRHGVLRERYVRDACGNVLAKYASDGRSLLQFQIGNGNKPVQCTLASGDVHSFAYDASGRYVLAATAESQVEFAYDALGNRVLEKRNGLGIEAKFQGRRAAELTILERFKVSYSRQGRTLVITDPGGQQQRIDHLATGVLERHFSNGSRELAQYDALRRCLFKHVQRAAVAQPWMRRYEWSGEGELRSVADNLYGEVRYEYDAAHRLRSRNGARGQESFVQDAADNLLSQPGLAAVELLQGNRLAAANGEQFVYNDRNHIARRSTNDRTIDYLYDSRDQLVRVVGPSEQLEASYDALGRRTAKLSAGHRTTYYWNTDQLLAEVQAGGRLRLYIYTDSLALSPLMFIDYDSIDAAPDSGRRYFIFCDQIGTPCLIENEKGEEVWSARTDPFGQTHVSATASVQCPLRFPGHYFDAETGLHYNRFRYYDPVLGRYLQSDPWGLAGGYNLYAYRTNPLGVVDVRGLGEQPPKDKDDPNTKKPGEGCPDSESTPPGEGAPAGRPRPLTREEGQQVVDRLHEAMDDPKKQAQSVTTLSQTEDGTLIVTNSDSVRPSTRAAIAEMQQPGGLLEGREVRAGSNVRGDPDYIPPADRPLTNAPNPDRAGDGEQRGVQAASTYDGRGDGNGPVTRQWSSGSADHGGAACRDCETVQRQNGIVNETGYQSQGGRYDRGGTEPPWNGVADPDYQPPP